MSSDATDYTDVVSVFHDLIAESAGTLVRVVMDSEEDIEPVGGVSLLQVVRLDVRRIFTEFVVQADFIPSPLVQLNQALSRLWDKAMTPSKSFDELHKWQKRSRWSIDYHGTHYGATEHELYVPEGLSLMGKLDQTLGTRVSGLWADAFKLLVVHTAACYEYSIAIEKLKYEYMTVLGLTAQSSASQIDRARCGTCTQSYRLLELPFGSNKEAVASARREMAKSFHPDVWANKRGAKAAEEQLKEINVAHDHLTECPLSPARG